MQPLCGWLAPAGHRFKLKVAPETITFSSFEKEEKQIYNNLLVCSEGADYKKYRTSMTIKII
jgi:hypothetical protein